MADARTTAAYLCVNSNSAQFRYFNYLFMRGLYLKYQLTCVPAKISVAGKVSIKNLSLLPVDFTPVADFYKQSRY